MTLGRTLTAHSLPRVLGALAVAQALASGPAWGAAAWLGARGMAVTDDVSLYTPGRYTRFRTSGGEGARDDL